MAEVNSGSVAFEPHDHANCVAQTIATAEALCAERGLRLTPLRRCALEVLASEHKALGAYEVLERMSKEGHPAHPPVAYRALEFLVNLGLAHKIERLAAFIACSRPSGHHRPAFLICRKCRTVAETQVPLGNGALGHAAESLGFHVEQTVVEAEGVCRACQDA